MHSKDQNKISKICFGTLTTSPLQRNFSAAAAASLYLYAYKKGINFFDTAELYSNYHHFKRFLEIADTQKKRGYLDFDRKNIVIATKSYAYDSKTLKASVDKALREIGTDYVDYFLLHEQESEHTIRGHYDALCELQKLKEKGVIKKIGLSTHFVAGAKAANKYREMIDVLHPIINLSGFGIQDGAAEDMLEQIDRFYKSGGFIYAMKIFGGGNLLSNYRTCFDFALKQKSINSLAIGMSNKQEVDDNIDFINGGYTEPIIKYKKLHIADWCVGCGKCKKRCINNAIRIDSGKAVVDHNRCLTCGYCASVCSELCIKIY